MEFIIQCFQISSDLNAKLVLKKNKEKKKSYFTPKAVSPKPFST